MSLINENKLRNLIKEVCDKKNEKLQSEINSLYKNLDRMRERLNIIERRLK